MGERLHEIWQRIVADIHRNPGLWIGVGLTAVILLIAYLAYRRSQSQGVVPANGYGFPDYGGATGGSAGGGGGLGYQPYQPPSAPGQPVTNPFQPVAPVSDGGTPFPPFSFGPPAGGGSSTSGPAGYQVQGNVQNPSAQQDAQHQGIAIPSIPIQNPSAAQDAQHRGVTPSPQNPLAAAQQTHRGAQPVLPIIQNPTAASQQAHRGARRPAPRRREERPVTTTRPRHTGHGRVA